MQAIASDDAAPIATGVPGSTTSWPAVTPLTALTSSRGGLGRAKPPSVSSSCSTVYGKASGALHHLV